MTEFASVLFLITGELCPRIISRPFGSEMQLAKWISSGRSAGPDATETNVLLESDAAA